MLRRLESQIVKYKLLIVKYLFNSAPAPGTVAENYFQDNPLVPPLEVISIDFGNPPSQITIRTANGFLTPAEGIPLVRDIGEKVGRIYWKEDSP